MSQADINAQQADHRASLDSLYVDLAGGTMTGMLEIQVASEQLRLAYDADSFTSFTVGNDSTITITPAETGRIVLQPTTDSTTFFQVLDADGGVPILNVDSTNLMVGVNEPTPGAQLHIQTSGAAVVGQIIKGTAAQSGNYLQVQTSADALEVVIDSAGNLHLKTNNELRFYDNGNYVGFEAPALAADQIWVLPDADGNASDVLKTDGAGNLGWADPTSIIDTILCFENEVVCLDDNAVTV